VSKQNNKTEVGGKIIIKTKEKGTMKNLELEIVYDMKMDTRHRRWFLVINNYTEDWSQEQCKKLMESLGNAVKYYCLSDEIGDQGTPHRNLYFELHNAMRFSRVKSLFPEWHIGFAKSLGHFCRAYIGKMGERNADKAHTLIGGTFFEQGEVPQEKNNQGKRTDIDIAKEMVRDGNDVFDIIEMYSHLWRYEDYLERYKQEYLIRQFKGKRSKPEFIFISGPTNVGKSTWAFDTFGDENICYITDYEGNGVFDSYTGQEVLLLDEFDSSINIKSMNAYADRFNAVTLPARYYNRKRAYSTLVVISNLPLEQHYLEIQKKKPEVWKAFCRRIDKIMVYTDFLKFDTYETTGSQQTGDQVLASDKYFRALSDVNEIA